MRWLGGVFASSRAKFAARDVTTPSAAPLAAALSCLADTIRPSDVERCAVRRVGLQADIAVARQHDTFGHRLGGDGRLDAGRLDQVGRQVGVLAGSTRERRRGVAQLGGGGVAADADGDEHRPLAAGYHQRLSDRTGEPVPLQCGPGEPELARNGSGGSDSEPHGVGGARGRADGGHDKGEIGHPDSLAHGADANTPRARPGATDRHLWRDSCHLATELC